MYNYQQATGNGYKENRQQLPAYSSNQSGQDQEPAKKPFRFLQVTAYGKSSAVQCEPTTTSSGWLTVRIESAAKASGEANERKYRWADKLSIHLTQNELPWFVAVAFGLLPSIRFDNHGDASKWLEIFNQGKGYFFRCGSKLPNSLMATPVGLADMAMFGCIALSQYAQNFGISTDSALESIKSMAQLAYTNESFNKAR